MRHSFKRLTGSLAVVALIFCAFAFAAAPAEAKSANLDKLQVLTTADTTGPVKVEVKASLPASAKLPQTVTLRAPSFLTPKNAFFFNTSDGKDQGKAEYKVTKKKGYKLYTFELKKTDALAMTFESEPFTNSEMGHLLFGFGWTTTSEVNEMFVAAAVDDTKYKVNPIQDVDVIGYLSNGQAVYASISKEVTAGAEKKLQMALTTPSKTTNDKTTQETAAQTAAKKSAAKTRNLVIIIAAVLLVIAVAVLVAVIARNKRDGGGDDDENDIANSGSKDNDDDDSDAPDELDDGSEAQEVEETEVEDEGIFGNR